jgi:hypothetical protein
MHSASLVHRPQSLLACLAAVAVLLVAWNIPAQEQNVPTKAEIENLQHADLMVLSKTLKTYRVDQVPASKALEQIWIQAASQPPQLMPLRWRSEDKSAVEPTLTLNLHNVSATEIIRYISELSASRWEIRGWSGDALMLTLNHLTYGDDSCLMVYVSTARVDARGADLLGLKPDMPSADVVAALCKFGVPFNDGKKAPSGLQRRRRADHRHRPPRRAGLPPCPGQARQPWPAQTC